MTRRGRGITTSDPSGTGGGVGPKGADGKDGINGTNGVGTKGDKGDKGDTGSSGLDGTNGPANTLNISTITTLAAGANATATVSGTSPNQTLSLGIPRGANGSNGTNGTNGLDAKRIDTYIGTTDANGLYTVTYATAFPAIPSIQPEPPISANQVWVKVTSTTTGFSLRLVQRAALTVLALEVLAAATTNVVGGAARVVVIAA